MRSCVERRGSVGAPAVRLLRQRPHYHYIRQADQQNVVVRFDQFAEGDARDWTLGRLRSRLPHMLGFLGLTELADSVQATDLEPAVAEVERLLSR
ncbi:hypothetical protein GS415_07780 [Rhodococcus hoagii]|nr:hypothetical protein [Prescottella equi]